VHFNGHPTEDQNFVELKSEIAKASKLEVWEKRRFIARTSRETMAQKCSPRPPTAGRPGMREGETLAPFGAMRDWECFDAACGSFSSPRLPRDFRRGRFAGAERSFAALRTSL